jgi:mono/diheme cytochrome c family protein
VAFAGLLAPLVLAGCSRSEDVSTDPAVARGHEVYKSVCLACHAPNPVDAGSLGPPIAGSSRALIEARVIHADYPNGYTPKRSGKTMPAFPNLAGSIDDLTAYLAQAGH